MKGCKMGVMINASLSMLNANSHSLEKWNGVFLAISEDKGNLSKVLDKSLVEIGVSKKRSYVFHTSGEEDEVYNQIHFCLI